METLDSIQINSLKLKSKTSTNARGERYVDVLTDDGNLCFSLGSLFFKTQRGMYSNFVSPNKCTEFSLSTISKLCSEHGNPIESNKTTYLDIVLDTNVPEQRAVFKSLKAFTEVLRNKLVDSIMDSSTDINKHVNKYCDNTSRESIGREINFMYLRDNNNRSNIVYIHLKVDKNTKSYDVNNKLIDNKLLCYKNYKLSPIVKIDNIRIPHNRNEHNRINVHMYVIKQIVAEYTDGFEE